MEDKYATKIEEMKTLERIIKKDLSEFQKKVDTEENTIALERTLEKNLNLYSTAQATLNKEYQDKSYGYISNLPPKEYNKRVTDIRNMLITNDKINADFKAYQSAKYKFKPKNSALYEDYSETDAMKNMNNNELFQDQQKKIVNQNAQIEDIIGMTKEGKNMAIEIGKDLKNQNEMLDNVEKDMDQLDDRMDRTKQKFEAYIDKSSHCCLIIIAVVEAVALGLIIWLM